MGVNPDGTLERSDYDRIVLVGHSLGTIVGYDILTHCFGRINEITGKSLSPDLKQPARDRLEHFIREAEKSPEEAWASTTLDDFRAMQSAALEELRAIGNPWIVTDFVTLGSPLTHAEFLMERDREQLRQAQTKRIMPTCPPTLEFDGRTKLKHFSYRHRELRSLGQNDDPLAPRVPHHAALFAYTRWTNIFSPHWLIATGDIISGPLAHAMGMPVEGHGEATVSGIRDIAVLPSEDGTPADKARRRQTHLDYWDRSVAKVPGSKEEPAHIVALRKALNLGEA